MSYGAEYFGPILGVSPALLENLDHVMVPNTGRQGVLDKLANENEKRINSLLGPLHKGERNSIHIIELLRNLIGVHERQLRGILDRTEGKDQFEKAANLSLKITSFRQGFFLKREYASKILETRPPVELLKHFGGMSIIELLKKEDVTEVFSALRFTETDAWMHETFEKAYSDFTASDFEQRNLEVRVLGPQWADIAKKFVAKKHHNVSHLKEFGVIFLNPIFEDVSGKLLRDFALLLHYFHEMEFYSELFRHYAERSDFATQLKALLRGDVKKVDKLSPGTWLIVQRYLTKEDPSDPRLFIPRVNPESRHWMRAERDLVNFGLARTDLDLELWQSMDWVGTILKKSDPVISFDLEDNAMSHVSFFEGKKEYFAYHQREALWTKIFQEYVGGEKEMERYLIKDFENGMIVF